MPDVYKLWITPERRFLENVNCYPQLLIVRLNRSSFLRKVEFALPLDQLVH